MHAHTHSHTQTCYSLNTTLTQIHHNTLCGRCILCMCVLCSWQLCNYLWEENIKILQALVSSGKIPHRINKGVRGPAPLSDTHPDWEERGFGDESCSCIFYNLFCNHLLPDTLPCTHTHTNTHIHARIQSSLSSRNLPLFSKHYTCYVT